MDEARARQFFLDGAATEFVSTTPVPDLTQADCETTIKRAKKILEESVTARESWPIGWAFRDLDDATFQDGWFVDRFEPTKVMLKKERLPRLALKLGGSDALRKRSIMHEVYLRTSTAVKPKAANSKGLTLNIAVPTYADLFGLINSKCMRGCKGLFLVEGPYDALRLLQHLNSKEIGGGFEVVAILGTPQWANVMERIPQALGERSKTPVILAFDNDGAGKKLTDTALWNLQMRFSKRKIIQLEYPETIKDPGDLSFTDFLTAFNSLGL
jgi:hypothetical protein